LPALCGARLLPPGLRLKPVAGPQYAVVRVLVERTYLVPVSAVDPNRTQINGWTLKQVAEDWFDKHADTHCHASRDYHKAGEKFVAVEITDERVG
jgi:hypothetical protein